MQILIVHNHYGSYAQGGEASVVKLEAALLKSYGHDVRVYERSNSEIMQRGAMGRFQTFLNIGWSREGYNAIADEIRKFRPDIMHVHNYKYLLSPSIFGAAKDLGVATVLTLHNYRLACPGGQFFRNNFACDACLDGFPYRMLWHRCASPDVIKNLAQFYLYWSTTNRKLLTPWVDAYIALSYFGKSKFISAGLPQDQIFVKSNFINDPSFVSPLGEDSGRAIFVGRLSKEKGLDVLIDAWRDIDYPLQIVGDGPLMNSIRRHASPRTRFEGALPRHDTIKQMAQSSFFVFPSACYEGCPMTVIEAMALGKPVVATDLGPRREMVIDGYNGFLYPPNNVNILQKRISQLIKNHELRRTMGNNARDFYLSHFAPEANYHNLLNIYRRAISRRYSA